MCARVSSRRRFRKKCTLNDTLGEVSVFCRQPGSRVCGGRVMCGGACCPKKMTLGRSVTAVSTVKHVKARGGAQSQTAGACVEGCVLQASCMKRPKAFQQQQTPQQTTASLTLNVLVSSHHLSVCTLTTCPQPRRHHQHARNSMELPSTSDEQLTQMSAEYQAAFNSGSQNELEAAKCRCARQQRGVETCVARKTADSERGAWMLCSPTVPLHQPTWLLLLLLLCLLLLYLSLCIHALRRFIWALVRRPGWVGSGAGSLRRSCWQAHPLPYERFCAACQHPTYTCYCVNLIMLRVSLLVCCSVQVHNNTRANQVRGLDLAAAALENDARSADQDRELRYYLAVGQYKLGRCLDARRTLAALLQVGAGGGCTSVGRGDRRRRWMGPHMYKGAAATMKLQQPACPFAHDQDGGACTVWLPSELPLPPRTATV